MAATRLIPLHLNKGKTLVQCLSDRTDYSENASKTENGKYLSSYACTPETCDEEFLFTKRLYEHRTGRKQRKDGIVYQIRQSFKPGEITPEEANEIGYELAMRFTKGKHAFLVATHIDKVHIHNHIIFNSTTIDGKRKFRDFWFSGLALARKSDILCLEHQLSVIEKKPYAEREKRTTYLKRTSFRDSLRDAIEAALLQNPESLDALCTILEKEGYEVKKGKHLAFRMKNQKRFIRLRSLGAYYSEENLRKILNGEPTEVPKPEKKHTKPHEKTSYELSFLVDIQKKMQEGKGEGYKRWAKVFNVKQMDKTLYFMEEHKIKSYEELFSKAKAFTEEQDTLLSSIKADEARLQEITVLRTHLIHYAKSRETFLAYKESHYSRKFFEEHREILTLRNAAKAYFEEYKQKNGVETLPKVKELGSEYAELLARKKANYVEYRKKKEEAHDWIVAEQIVRRMLDADEKNIQRESEQYKEKETPDERREQKDER